MRGRASEKKIIVVSNSLGGKVVDLTTREDGTTVVFDQATGQYIHVDLLQLSDITFEALYDNGDVGPGADQVAAGNHDHDVGNLNVLFENRIS